MNLQVPPGTVLQVTLSSHAEALYVTELAKANAAADKEQAALEKVYTIKELEARTKLSHTTLRKYLNTPECHGGIRHQRAGDKYLVTEQAVREWFRDRKAAA